MSLGYDVNQQTLSGVVDYYANHIETETLTVNGIDITGRVVGPTGATGPQGPQGIQGIQGPQGAKGDAGDPADTSAIQAQVVVLDALVAGLGVSTVALGVSVATLQTEMATVQGEVGILGGEVETLANNTKFISSTTKTIVASELDITNGVSNIIALKTDGTIECKNINPVSTPLGTLNIATAGTNETVKIGNRSSRIEVNGSLYFNNSLATDAFNLQGFVNQWI
jgi:hypothetical protein